MPEIQDDCERRVHRKANASLGLLLVGLSATMCIYGEAKSHTTQNCDRGCLEEFVDLYLDAVVANRPSQVPMSANVRFTENGQDLAIGDGLWTSMRAKGKYRLFITDARAGQVGFVGSIHEDNREPNKGTPALIALRLKVLNQQVVEVEQLVIRDAEAATRLDSLTPDPAYSLTVPEPARMSRAALIAKANQYFSDMQRYDYAGDELFSKDCVRHENGVQTANAPTPAGQIRPDPKTSREYSRQWSCQEQFSSGLMHYFVTRIRDRRFVAVDEERGIVFALVFIDHAGGADRTFKTPDGRTINLVDSPVPPLPITWEVAEVFKVEGRIHKIDALLQSSPYGMNSGWSTLAEGRSDHARDVTMK